MKPQIALLLLYSLLFVEGGFEERKKFHDWLCQKSPSLQSCSKPFTMSTYRKELATFRRNKELMFQKASTNGRIEDDSIEESDDDYEFYLWKKYLYRKYRKLLRKLKEERSEEETSRAITTGQQRYNSVRNSQYYTYPSYYSYPVYRYAYPCYVCGYGYGYPAYFGYGGYGFPFLFDGNLLNLGIGTGVGVGTPLGNMKGRVSEAGLDASRTHSVVEASKRQQSVENNLFKRQQRYRPASTGSFPSFGGGGLSGLSNLFSFGISNGVGVGTPIGNFGVSSGFGLGIG